MIKQMRKKLENIKRQIKKKYNALRTLLVNSWCYFIYYHVKLDDNLIFLESRDGKDFTGNIFRIVEELSKEEYKNFKIVIWARKDIHKKIRKLVKTYQLKKLRLVASENRAVAVMERAKYIVSDSGVPWKYVKRHGQIVLNTWHGTPLKVMGRQTQGEKHKIGTTQHMFFSSDYLLYPSEYMKCTMLQAYMMENVISGKALMSGYPRNSVFFDGKKREYYREIFGFGDKEVFVYMPTHRGSVEKNRKNLEIMVTMLLELDANLRSDQLVLAKLHVLDQNEIDFSQFEHIQPFPDGYETYDVLNTADCLITDYSSVFFDFANTRRKIILFTYDEETYIHNRGGLFFSLSELPFPRVKDVQGLLAEMNSEKTYEDKSFLQKFCPYDAINATEKLCKHVFKGEKSCKEVSLGNGKKNILIYAGSLAKNGITTALCSLLDNIDTTKQNYYLSLRRQELDADPSRVNIIPDDIGYMPIMSDQQYTLQERWRYNRYYRKRNSAQYTSILRRIFIREFDRCYWGAKFDYVIQFDGYGVNMPLLFLEAPCPKTIFVHNDMVQELKTKRNQHKNVLRNAYQKYDNVAVVSPDLIAPTTEVGAPKEKIVVINNIHDLNTIRQKAEGEITFEKDTEIRTYHPGGIEGVLNSNCKKFITIGRFSREKGHQRLLKAFDHFCDLYSNTQLIIIGGYGALYNETIKWAKQLRHWRNVTIIKSVRNPMPILKRCDLFILSSFYEGLGLVLLEADCLGVPTFSTDIVGPKMFMEKYHGHLVENSEKGILQGMYDFIDGKVHTLDIDYHEYNQKALREFYDICME